MESSVISFGDLRKIREMHPKTRIVFCSGTFDLPHAGHVLFLEDCKKHGDILVVGVGCDSIVREYKGAGRPILNEDVRVKIISSFKPVDYVFIDTPRIQGDVLCFIKDVFGELRPDTYVFNTDAFDIPYREAVAKEYGVKTVVLKRWCPPEFQNISTSAIIRKTKEGNT